MKHELIFTAFLVFIFIVTSSAQSTKNVLTPSGQASNSFINKNLIPIKQLHDQKKYIFSGHVYDSETGCPLPGTNIRVSGTNKGTSTNKDGAFRLLLDPGNYLIIISYIGFQSDTLSINVINSNIERTIFLRAAALHLQEVVVYSEKLNPAEQIILRAIEKKKDILSQLYSYQFNAYTKTTFRVVKESEIGPDSVIAGLLETQTDGYWKSPTHYKEIITARRQSANFSPAQNIFTLGRIPNLNDDIIVIEPHSIISPTNPNALENYFFEMEDTLAMDGIPIYRIRIKPKSKLKPLFDGLISIADQTFLVMQVDVHGNESLDLAPLHNIRIQQQFALFEEKFWLPIESRIMYDVKFSFPPTPPILWEQYSMIYNYRINTELEKSLFDRYTLSALSTASDIDSLRWQRFDILPLTYDEANAYHRIDSIMQHTSLFARAIIFLTRFPQTMKELPFTTFSDFFHFNRAEGFFLGIGMKLDNLFPSTNFKLRTGYGLSDKRWKYSLETEQFFSKQRKTSFGLDYYRKIQYREGEETFSRGIITVTSLLDKNDPVDYFESEGWKLSTWINPFPSVNLKLLYLNETHRSVSKKSEFSIFSPSASFRKNPAIYEGQLRSVTFSLSYDTRKFIDLSIFEAEDKGENSLLFDFSFEHSNKHFLKSDFDFSRLFASMRIHQLTFWSGTLNVNLKLGFSTGGVPPQRYFDLLGTFSSISPPSHLKTISVKDFAGDRIASLQIEHNFGSVPFRAAGLSFIANTDLITYFGMGWSDFSRDALIPQLITEQPTKNLLCELGFGLGRILTFFRLDFTWRITMRAQNNFQMTLSSAL
ncbi:MAG: DUF5686 and carboxypeptidase regulatory-like domain-containing protein [Bacteroidetes bacterium]|nr:DUF5686 and carboxypeptidase regulatory-like domain-containing protein [Bacteroidota bacterium]